MRREHDHNDGTLTTLVDGSTSTTSGPTQRTPTVPRRWPAVSSQLGTPGIAVGDDEPDAAVGFELGRVAVQVAWWWT